MAALPHMPHKSIGVKRISIQQPHKHPLIPSTMLLKLCPKMLDKTKISIATINITMNRARDFIKAKKIWVKSFLVSFIFLAP